MRNIERRLPVWLYSRFHCYTPSSSRKPNAYMRSALRRFIHDMVSSNAGPKNYVAQRAQLTERERLIAKNDELHDEVVQLKRRLNTVVNASNANAALLRKMAAKMGVLDEGGDMNDGADDDS